MTKRFFPTVADLLVEDNPVFAEKLRRAMPHWMRHTRATRALHAGAELITVRDNLRNSSLAMTSMYLHPDSVQRAPDGDGVCNFCEMRAKGR